MKKNIVAALLATFSISATAQQKIDCEALSEKAISFMEARQAEQPIHQTMSEARYVRSYQLKLIYDEIINDAYSQPLVSNNRLQQHAISLFQAKWYHTCRNSY